MSTQAIIVVDNLNDVPREYLPGFIAQQLMLAAGMIKLGKGTKEINETLSKMSHDAIGATLDHRPETSVSLPYLTQADM
jgi:hypothetical protein